MNNVIHIMVGISEISLQSTPLDC